MLTKVVLLALPGVAPFEFGVICEVFGIDRTSTGGPTFDFTIATADPGPVRTSLGFDMTIAAGLDVAADADLIAVPAHTMGGVDERFLDVIRAAHARGAWILSVCSGAFVLAEAGVLDGHRATTHWMHTARLAAEYPSIDVDPDVLFVEDRRVITSAGTAAGIDAALHLVRLEHGATAANVIARRMVIPPQRDGGQAQYIPTPVQERCSDSLAPVTDWMLDNLSQDLTIEHMARKALMSSRTSARPRIVRSRRATPPGSARMRASLASRAPGPSSSQRLIRVRGRASPAVGSQTPCGNWSVLSAAPSESGAAARRPCRIRSAGRWSRNRDRTSPAAAAPAGCAAG